MGILSDEQIARIRGKSAMSTVILTYTNTTDNPAKSHYMAGALRRRPLSFNPLNPEQVDEFLVGLHDGDDAERWRQVIVGYWGHGLTGGVLAHKLGLKRTQIRDTVKLIRRKDRQGAQRSHSDAEMIRRRNKRRALRGWLTNYLSNGARYYRDIVRDGLVQGYSRDQLDNAKEKIGAFSVRIEGRYCWSLGSLRVPEPNQCSLKFIDTVTDGYLYECKQCGRGLVVSADMIGNVPNRVCNQ